MVTKFVAPTDTTTASRSVIPRFKPRQAAPPAPTPTSPALTVSDPQEFARRVRAAALKARGLVEPEMPSHTLAAAIVGAAKKARGEK
jgi:hypothetical protein